MQWFSIFNLSNQVSRTVRPIISLQTNLTDDQIEAFWITIVRCWRDGIHNEGLTVAASVRIVGEQMANLYRWEADHKVHSRRPKFVRTNNRTLDLKQAIKEVR